MFLVCLLPHNYVIYLIIRNGIVRSAQLHFLIVHFVISLISVSKSTLFLRDSIFFGFSGSFLGFSIWLGWVGSFGLIGLGSLVIVGWFELVRLSSLVWVGWYGYP